MSSLGILAGMLKPVGEAFFRLRGLRASADASHPRRILIIRADEAGDVVLTVPVLRTLRQAFPDAHLTLVVKPAFRDLFSICPYVNSVLTFDPDGNRPIRARRFWRALRLAWGILWKERYDTALQPRWDADTAHATWLAYLSGARVRIGYSETVTPFRQQVNRGYDRLLTQTWAPVGGVRHEVLRNLDLLEALHLQTSDTHLELWADPADLDFAAQHLDTTVGSPPWIAICAGAREAKRIWPEDAYRRVALAIHRSRPVRFVFLGGNADASWAHRLAASTGALDLTGRTTLRQAFATLQRCRLYLGADSGLMHMAAAAGIPVVEVSCHPATAASDHRNSPERFSPWGVPSRICRPTHPRSPCEDGCEATEAHCICDVTEESVLNDALALLQTHGQSAREVGP